MALAPLRLPKEFVQSYRNLKERTYDPFTEFLKRMMFSRFTRTGCSIIPTWILICLLIERNDFIPSIKQLEALSRALQFKVTDLIIDETPNQFLFALRSDNYFDQEKDDVEHLTTLMMTLIQQIRLRLIYENKTHPFD